MSGQSSDYTTAPATDLTLSLAAALDGWDGDGAMSVTADIEWNGDWNRQPHRHTTIPQGGQLDLGAVRAAVAHAMSYLRAKPTHKGWSAQIREITKSKAGYEAGNRAGIDVSRETLLRWLSGEQTPSAANQRKIEAASTQLWWNRTAGARERAVHDAADALTDAVREAEGDDVRFRDITGLDFN